MDEELARAQAYQAQQVRRRAAETARAAMLRGSASARARLDARWAPWWPTVVRPGTPPSSEPPTDPLGVVSGTVTGGV